MENIITLKKTAKTLIEKYESIVNEYLGIFEDKQNISLKKQLKKG